MPSARGALKHPILQVDKTYRAASGALQARHLATAVLVLKIYA